MWNDLKFSLSLKGDIKVSLVIYFYLHLKINYVAIKFNI